jgi:hypothetical protein
MDEGTPLSGVTSKFVLGKFYMYDEAWDRTWTEEPTNLYLKEDGTLETNP